MKSKMIKFYKTLDEIKLRNQSLSDKIDVLKDYVGQLNKEVANIGLYEDITKQNKELFEQFGLILTVFKESIKVWNNKIEQTIKDEEFRNEFENYFIVMIFGKVKAGKSYLGNFIKDNRLDTQEANRFEYDAGGNKNKIAELVKINEELKTDVVECTSSIQVFTLSGLAWVDTPGLGSTKQENGELAKQYVSKADYIIYPSSSTAPFEIDEIIELKEAFDIGKKATVIIIKSDRLIEDEKDGKIVKVRENKDLQTRKNQEQDSINRISERLGKESVKDLDIFSLSTLTAKEALEENDKDKFENSNILELYEKLTDVLVNKAEMLKKQSPYNELKSIINNMLNNKEYSVENILAKIKEFQELNKKTKDDLERLKDNTISDIRSTVERIVAKYANDIDNANLKDKLKIIDKEIKKEVYEEIEHNLKQIIQNYQETQDALVDNLSYEYSIEDKVQDLRYSTKARNKAMGAAAGAAAGSFIPVVGTLVGGVVGGVVGGFAGGKVGEWISEEKVEKIKIGDNTEEVIFNLKENRIKHFSKIAKGTYKKYSENLFIPIENETIKFENSINKFNENLTKLLKEIQ